MCATELAALPAACRLHMPCPAGFCPAACASGYDKAGPSDKTCVAFAIWRVGATFSDDTISGMYTPWYYDDGLFAATILLWPTRIQLSGDYVGGVVIPDFAEAYYPARDLSTTEITIRYPWYSPHISQMEFLIETGAGGRYSWSSETASPSVAHRVPVRPAGAATQLYLCKGNTARGPTIGSTSDGLNACAVADGNIYITQLVTPYALLGSTIPLLGAKQEL